MNISIREAFLGKNQMKDWATPVSEWIPCKDDRHSDHWSQEFCEAFGISDNKANVEMPYYFATGEASSSMSSGSTSQRPKAYEFYWNKEHKDIFIIITMGEDRDSLEVNLKMVEGYIDADVERARRNAKQSKRVDFDKIDEL
jgi:hypothetical protein